MILDAILEENASQEGVLFDVVVLSGVKLELDMVGDVVVVKIVKEKIRGRWHGEDGRGGESRGCSGHGGRGEGRRGHREVGARLQRLGEEETRVRI